MSLFRYYLSGPKAGTKVFADNLVGIPDNISPASSGGYWVGSGASRHSGYFVFLHFLARWPRLKNIVAKVSLSQTYNIVLFCLLIAAASDRDFVSLHSQDWADLSSKF